MHTAVTAVPLCQLCRLWSSQNHIFDIPHSLSSVQLGIVKLSCDANTHKSWSDWIFVPKDNIFHINKTNICMYVTSHHTRLCQSQSVTITSSAPGVKSKRLFLEAIMGPRQLNNGRPSRPVTSRQSGSLAERGRPNCLYI